MPALSSDAQKALADIVSAFDAGAAQKVKDIEATTNHDVKAVEYYLKDAFAASGSAELARVAEFLHFACTSEDVNNLAYALMVQHARREVMAPTMARVIDSIAGIGAELADAPMMARTHGQPATPTTMGKEFANHAYRLGRQLRQFNAVEVAGKFNGAVGNFNAHVVAYPALGSAGWVNLAKTLVEGHLGLAYNPYSTQIECHDWMAEAFHALSRFNTVLLDFDRDVWGYISVRRRCEPVAPAISSRDRGLTHCRRSTSRLALLVDETCSQPGSLTRIAAAPRLLLAQHPSRSSATSSSASSRARWAPPRCRTR